MEMTTKCPNCADGEIEVSAEWEPADRSVGIYAGWVGVYAAPCTTCGYLMDDDKAADILDKRVESDNESFMVDEYQGRMER